MAEYEKKCRGNEGAEVPLFPSNSVFFFGDFRCRLYCGYVVLYLKISGLTDFCVVSVFIHLSDPLPGLCADFDLS